MVLLTILIFEFIWLIGYALWIEYDDYRDKIKYKDFDHLAYMRLISKEREATHMQLLQNQ